MKNYLSLCLGISILSPSAGAGEILLAESGLIQRDIPDGNIAGVAHTLELSLGSGVKPVGEVSVSLSILGRDHGGFNGDLFAYVVHDGRHAVLLNRPGRTSDDSIGYSHSGMNVTFRDSALYDVHLYGEFSSLVYGPLTGTWRPDGRTADPITVLDTDPSHATLDMFHGADSSGLWTLFVADLEAGGTSRLVGWQLQITPIPEPREYAVLAGVGLLGWGVLRRRSATR